MKKVITSLILIILILQIFCSNVVFAEPVTVVEEATEGTTERPGEVEEPTEPTAGDGTQTATEESTEPTANDNIESRVGSDLDKLDNGGISIGSVVSDIIEGVVRSYILWS